VKRVSKTLFFLFVILTTLSVASCKEDEVVEMVVRIIFESNGGTMIEPIEYDGEDTSVWPDDPVREGYAFAGWYTDNELYKDLFDLESVEVEDQIGDITVYAWWTPVLYTMTFHDTGGTTIDPVTYTYGSPTTEPDEPVWVGYTFDGWYEDAAKEIPHEFGPMPGNDVDLFGKWTKNSYNVNFDSMGGTMIPPERYAYEEQMQEPVEPVKTGHEFLGWFLTPISEYPFTFDEMPPYDLDLVARWEPIIYEVRFETNGGTMIESRDIPYGEPVVQPTDPVKEGQTFAGWFSDALWQQPFVFGPMPDHDIDLYAAWAVTLSFETFEGSDVPSLTEYPNTPITEPDDPVLEDHDFHGWYTDELLTTPFVFDFMPEVHTTVYAKWLPSLVTVDFVSNGGEPLESLDLPIGSTLVSVVTTKEQSVFAGWYAEETLETRIDYVPTDPIVLHARWLDFELATIGTRSNYHVPVGHEGDGTDEVMGGFDMGVTEVTYPVWYEVKLWALANGYAFENEGREGSQGTIGAEPTGVLLPVSTISFRDVIVWLNALSERSGRTAVYRDGLGEIIRDATTDAADFAIQTNEHGYRLPVTSEWSLAASLLTDPEPLYEVTFTPSGYFTPGNYASGAHRAYDAFDGAETQRVSWFNMNAGGVMQEVAQLRVNQMGLYDMSGNAAELCFDTYEDVKVFVKGGSYYRGINNMQIAHLDAHSRTVASKDTGFRVILDAQIS